MSKDIDFKDLTEQQRAALQSLIEAEVMRETGQRWFPSDPYLGQVFGPWEWDGVAWVASHRNVS
jgi:hypothetical protein